MKFPVLWSGLSCYTVKSSEILAHIELLYNPRVNKVFTHSHTSNKKKLLHSLKILLSLCQTYKGKRMLLYWFRIVEENKLSFQVSHDHFSYECNLSNCVQKPEKVRTSTGFEPVTL